MPGPTGDGRVRGPAAAARREAEQRRRIDAAFGDTGYGVTSDERRAGEGFGDDWWTDQRPPHHG